jgi:hypothetical protein
MMQRRGVRVLSTLAALAFALASASAYADLTKAECIDDNSKGQDLRRDGKLSAASQALRACAAPSCPALVRDDCTRRLDDLQRLQPAIIFDAKDGDGRDLSLVGVTVDGAPLAEKLDGTPLEVDPGERVFVFTVPGQPPVTRTFVLKEGDKERRERVVIGAPVNGPTPASPATFASEPAHGSGTRKSLGLVAGGLGVAGVAVGGVFGAMTLSKVSAQKTDCASVNACTNPTQAASDHASAETDRTIATIGFIAGGALLVGGAVLFLTATGGHASEAPANAGLTVTPSAGPGGGGLLLKGAF